MSPSQNVFHLQSRKNTGKTLQMAIAIQHMMAKDPKMNVVLASHDPETGGIRYEKIVDVLLPRPLTAPSDDKGDA